MQELVDVLIFGGQSNMQGETEGIPANNAPVENALEYRYLTDSLVPLQHPVGEDLEDGQLWAADKGAGSLLPDFCRTYTELTGRKVVAIHAARGDTCVRQWLKKTTRYACALKKIKAGIQKAGQLGKIGNIFYIWLQGESDAIYFTSADSYIQSLTAYKNDLKQDAGIHKFGIIEVGYFCSIVDWMTNRSHQEAVACDEEIMEAQERITREDDDFVLLTQICKKLSRDPEYLNPYAQGHYNNKAMAVIGTEAAKTLAAL